jgi:hypothetical protein
MAASAAEALRFVEGIIEWWRCMSVRDKRIGDRRQKEGRASVKSGP